MKNKLHNRKRLNTFENKITLVTGRAYAKALVKALRKVPVGGIKQACDTVEHLYPKDLPTHISRHLIEFLYNTRAWPTKVRRTVDRVHKVVEDYRRNPVYRQFIRLNTFSMVFTTLDNDGNVTSSHTVQPVSGPAGSDDSFLLGGVGGYSSFGN